MILPIVTYGHPVLRQKGAKVETVTPEIRQLMRDMLDTMNEANGVGLAAQQVGHALQLTVIDVREAKDRPSTLEIGGQRVAVGDWMPMVLINPEIKSAGELVSGGEGCLSFPELYSEVTRAGVVDVVAMNGEGESVAFRAGGLLARAIQHETDHLHGILFIDRMASEKKRELQPELDELQAATKLELRRASKLARH
jgi:peptide deformylase